MILNSEKTFQIHINAKPISTKYITLIRINIFIHEERNLYNIFFQKFKS